MQGLRAALKPWLGSDEQRNVKHRVSHRRSATSVSPDRPRDKGNSLVEVMVSITILGGLGAAVMGGLLASVVGSRTERDHSRAHEWLQSATEVLVNDVPWKDCDPGTTDTNGPSGLKMFYQDEIQQNVDIVPPNWATYDLLIPLPVQYPNPAGAYSAGQVCDPDENRQKILIQVRSPDNTIIETVEVVKVP